MNAIVFQRLIEFADARGAAIQNADKNRFLKKFSDEDSELMSNAQFSSARLTRSVSCYRIEHGADTFFCLTGLSPGRKLPIGLQEDSLTPALFSICVAEGGMFPNFATSPFDIKDKIEDNFIGNNYSYDGHDLADIAELFPEIVVFRSVTREDYHSSIYSAATAIVASCYGIGPLELSDDLLDTFVAVAEAGSRDIPYDNFCRGLVSASWSSLYLELYRCIEQLYAMPRVLELSVNLPSTLAIVDLAEKLEKSLAWRPKEDEALVGLLTGCDDTIIGEICDAFGLTREPGKSARDICAKAIYRLRNGIVHHRRDTLVPDKTDSEWRAIVEVMLNLIDELYAKFSDRFFRAAA